MLDTRRLRRLEVMVCRGMDFKRALRICNQIELSMFVIKDEVNSILESSWGKDFNAKYGPYETTYYGGLR